MKTTNKLDKLNRAYKNNEISLDEYILALNEFKTVDETAGREHEWSRHLTGGICSIK